MKSNTLTYVVLFCLLFWACGEAGSGEDKASNNKRMYNSEEIGWTIAIPKGYHIIAKDEQSTPDPVGAQSIREMKGEDVDFSGVKFLISFKKNDYNLFQSTLEPFDPSQSGPWAESYEEMKDMMYAAYSRKVMGMDTSSSILTIDSLDFRVFHIKVKDANGNVMMHQELYNRYLNGYDFGVSMTYNNKEDERLMKNALMNSEFKSPHK